MRIRSGEQAVVELRPRQRGFFLPGGEFVTAYDHAPGFGEDLDESDKLWEGEEHDREWVDRENNAFNRTQVKGNARGRIFWEHGKRIEAYAEEHQRSISRLLRLLDKRKGPDGYSRHAHQTFLDFYRWKPNLEPSSPLLDWKWERIDAILRFSNSNQIRDHVLRILEDSDLGRLRDDLLSRLLGIKERRADSRLTQEGRETLERLRRLLKEQRIPDQGLVGEAIALVEGKADS